MKKIHALLILVLFATAFPAMAQFKQIAEGPEFEEPEGGYARIVQMKNGNTAFVHITVKKGIDLRIYDAAHKEKVATNIELSIERVKLNTEMTMFPKFAIEEIKGVFEINNDIVVFFHELDAKKSVLFRVIIDGNTGRLKEEKELFNKRFGPYDVQKDREGQNYSIYMSEFSEKEKKGIPHIIYYDAAHKPIHDWSFDSPETNEGNKYFNYKGMVTGEKGRVYAFFMTKGKSKEDLGNMYMVSMEEGNEKISLDKLNMPADLLYEAAIVKYDPVDRKIVFLILSRLKAKSSDFDAHLNIIDPVAKKMDKITDFGPTETLNQAYTERFDKKKGYAGLPQDIFTNADGSISIAYEEIMVQATTSGSYTRNDTKLGKIVINTIDKQGKLLSNYLLGKDHWVIFTQLGLFYHNQQEATAQSIWRGNEYKPFKYIDGPKGRFIFFNDTERNNEVKKDKFVEVQGVLDCDAFIHKLSGTEIFPPRAYAFGEPKKGHTLAMFSVSEYQRETNTMVTLKNEAGRSKKVKMVWLQPE